MPLIEMEEPVPQKTARFTLTQDFLFENQGLFSGLFEIPTSLGLKGKWWSSIGPGDFWSREKILVLEGDRHMVEPMIHAIMSALRA